MRVCDNVDVFDILGYLKTQDIREQDVVLCIFSCAHGRNYRMDSTARHTLMNSWDWKLSTFRTAAFEAMRAQLPLATCILTGRWWDTAEMQTDTRPTVHVPVRYAQQSGPPYMPEPSTRYERRPGTLCSTDSLSAFISVGPALASYMLHADLSSVDIPELTFQATGHGVVLFLGEFTLAHARHCAQYTLDRISHSIKPLMRRPALESESRSPERQDRAGNWFTYAECLDHHAEIHRPNDEWTDMTELRAAKMWTADLYAGSRKRKRE